MVKRGSPKSGKYLFSFLTMILMAAVLAGCHAYDGPYEQNGDFTVKYNQQKQFATVVEWKWDGDLGNTVIEIPDKTDDGVVIDGMGGVLGSNAPRLVFFVKTGDEVEWKGTDPANYKDVNVSFDEVVFTLKIGKNVEKVWMSYSSEESQGKNYIPVVQEDGSVIFYHVFFEVECSAENKKYYSKNGKLYDTKSNNKVEGISYTSDS